MVNLSFANFRGQYLLMFNTVHLTMIKMILGFCFKHKITLLITPKKLSKFDAANCQLKTKIFYYEANLSTQNWSN